MILGDDDIGPPAPILEVVPLEVDAPIQESIDFPTRERTGLVLEDGEIPIIEELLPPESAVREVETTIPPVGHKVGIPTIATIEHEGPVVDSFEEPVQLPSFPKLWKVTR